MLGIIPRSEVSRNEVAVVSSIGNWFVSYKDQSPFIGVEQDTCIGMFELTHHNVKLNKWHAMQLFSQIDTQVKRKVSFEKPMYTGRELVSKCLPRINYDGGRPKFYKPAYEKNKWIDYEPSDIKILVVNGELVSGVLDKDTVGSGSNNSLFHVIHNEHGAEMAIDCIYSFQQLITKFFYNHGFTVGIKDMFISEAAQQKIKINTAKILDESKKIHQRLVKRKIYAPIGQTLEEYYEALQVNALNPGDDFIGPILEDIEFYSNGLLKLVFSGSKGKIENVIAINAAVGQQNINNHRAPKQFGWRRTSPYFQRYDSRPIANGYIQQSFREGLPSESLLFIAQETRHALISNALSTALSGEQNRCAVKNLETAVINTLRMVTKNQSVVQILFAETGVDPRYSELMKFPTIMMKFADLESRYHTKAEMFGSAYNNANIQKILDEEFKIITNDRENYRSIFLKLESNNPGQTIMTDKIQMPVNIIRIIIDIKNNYKDISGKILDPTLAIQKVKDLCDELPYAHLNVIQEDNKGYLPYYLKVSVTFLSILLRSYLCTANLLKEEITDELLNKIIKAVKLVYKKSLIAYGTAIGIIASQCLSEPMTQFVLNSKHRSGAGGGTKTNQIVRIKEILGAKSTEKMKNPLMILRVNKEWENNKAKVQELANYIEMMTFRRFVNKAQIFFERYGQPVHPAYAHEVEMIKSFEHRHAGLSLPNDLSRWVLRFELDKDELILKSMKLDTIVLALRKSFKELFIVYTSENSNNLIMRCYIRNTFFKTIRVNDALHIQEKLESFKEKLYNLIIRGIEGISRAYVSELIMTEIATSDIEIKTGDKLIKAGAGEAYTRPVYAIVTDGTNLPEVLNLPFLDVLNCQTDSILEIEKIYGIDAARNKIMFEIMNAMKDQCTPITASLFADEMTSSGHVSSIEKTGLRKREPLNTLLQTSFQYPIQMLERAASENITSIIGGVSAQQIVGQGVRLGTTYSSVLLNQKFIEKNTKTLNDKIKDI
jgi:DNA-directed RNA polymerase II subunit RPB1